MRSLNDKSVVVWGFGKEGQSVLNFIQSGGDITPRSVTVMTPDPVERDIKGDLANNVKAEFICGQEGFDKIASGAYDIIVKSPGVSLYDPVIVAAKKAGSLVTSATNLWFETYPDAKTIVVTGTKGKSTTCSMLYHVLKTLGLDVVLAGNVGKALLGIKPGKDLTVIELSSYQLADLHHAPDLFVVLNLFPEHIPWHGSLEKYYIDKTSLFRHESKPDLILNSDNDVLMSYAKDALGSIATYSLKDLGQEVMAQITLKGDHNLSNFAAVLGVAERFGFSDSQCAQALTGFENLPHRLQEFQGQGGVLYVNDSISTTPQSTLAALHTYKDCPVFLIMGGTDRGQEYQDFCADIARFDIRHIFILPGHEDRLLLDLQKFELSSDLFSKAATMDEVMQKIAAQKQSGDCVLLSPAAPSFSQYKNFEERGDHFMDLAREIGAGENKTHKAGGS